MAAPTTPPDPYAVYPAYYVVETPLLYSVPLYPTHFYGSSMAPAVEPVCPYLLQGAFYYTPRCYAPVEEVPLEDRSTEKVREMEAHQPDQMPSLDTLNSDALLKILGDRLSFNLRKLKLRDLEELVQQYAHSKGNLVSILLRKHNRKYDKLIEAWELQREENNLRYRLRSNQQNPSSYPRQNQNYYVAPSIEAGRTEKEGEIQSSDRSHTTRLLATLEPRFSSDARKLPPDELKRLLKHCNRFDGNMMNILRKADYTGYLALEKDVQQRKKTVRDLQGQLSKKRQNVLFYRERKRT